MRQQPVQRYLTTLPAQVSEQAGPHQGSESFKLGCQFHWTNIVLLSLECPPKPTGVFAGHLTQLSCTPVQPRLLHPVSHSMEGLHSYLFFLI